MTQTDPPLSHGVRGGAPPTATGRPPGSTAAGRPPTHALASTRGVQYTMTDSTDLLTAARTEALFTSHLSAGPPPSRAAVHAAIQHAVRAYGGTRGCTGEVAAAYGEHPDTAAPRMRWAHHVIQALSLSTRKIGRHMR